MTTTVGPRNIRSILGDVFSIYKGNFFKLVGIVAMVEIPRVALYFLIFGAIMYAVDRFGGINIVTASRVAPAVIRVILGVIFYPLMGGALIHAISEQSLKQPISIGRSFRFVWRRLTTMIVAGLLFAFTVAGLVITVVGIPFAIYLIVRWIVVWQSILLERVGSRDALSRSSDLIKGNWWRVFGITFLVGVMTATAGYVFGLIPYGAIIGTILLTPIGIATVTLLYYDLRVRKEGYSYKTLAEELDIKINNSAV